MDVDSSRDGRWRIVNHRWRKSSATSPNKVSPAVKEIRSRRRGEVRKRPSPYSSSTASTRESDHDRRGTTAVVTRRGRYAACPTRRRATFFEDGKLAACAHGCSAGGASSSLGSGNVAMQAHFGAARPGRRRRDAPRGLAGFRTAPSRPGLPRRNAAHGGSVTRLNCRRTAAHATSTGDGLQRRRPLNKSRMFYFNQIGPAVRERRQCCGGRRRCPAADVPAPLLPDDGVQGMFISAHRGRTTAASRVAEERYYGARRPTRAHRGWHRWRGRVVVGGAPTARRAARLQRLRLGVGGDGGAVFGEVDPQGACRSGLQPLGCVMDVDLLTGGAAASPDDGRHASSPTAGSPAIPRLQVLPGRRRPRRGARRRERKQPKCSDGDIFFRASKCAVTQGGPIIIIGIRDGTHEIVVHSRRRRRSSNERRRRLRLALVPVDGDGTRTQTCSAPTARPAAAAIDAEAEHGAMRWRGDLPPRPGSPGRAPPAATGSPRRARSEPEKCATCGSPSIHTYFFITNSLATCACCLQLGPAPSRPGGTTSGAGAPMSSTSSTGRSRSSSNLTVQLRRRCSSRRPTAE